MEPQDTLTTTMGALREAIDQSVRGWVNSDPVFQGPRVRSNEEVIEDLTQHLFGNVVMALRFKPVLSGPRCEHGTYTDHVGCGNCMDNADGPAPLSMISDGRNTMIFGPRK